MKPGRVHVLERVYSGTSGELRVAYASHPGRVRLTNEDSVGLPPPTEPGDAARHAKGHLFLVADGVGGHASGEVAAQLAVQTAMSAYYASGREHDARTALRAAFDLAHERVLEASQQGQRQGMATTLVGTVVSNESVVLANVGDSRAYLWRQGALTQITRDHSLVAELVRQGDFTEDEAKAHPYRHVITQSIGGEQAISPGIHETTLGPGARLLLCTDGLTDVVDDAKIARILARPSLSEAAEKLVKAALAAGGPDNVTVLLIEPRRAVKFSARASVLDHPAAFPLFLGLGLLLVLVILYLVARAVLAPPVPQQPSPLPVQTPSLCAQGQVSSSTPAGYYLKGKVVDVRTTGSTIVVKVRNSSGDFQFVVEPSTVVDKSYAPGVSDIITAVLVSADETTSKAVQVDVCKSFWIFRKPWGNWVWTENLSELLLYTSSVDKRWIGLPKDISLPLVLSGKWHKPENETLPYFQVDEMYTWDGQAGCFASK